MREVVGGGVVAILVLWWYNSISLWNGGEGQDNFHRWVGLLVSQQWKLPVSSAEQSVGIQAEEHYGFPHYESYRNSVTVGVEVFSGKGYWSTPQSRSLETIITPTTWLILTTFTFFCSWLFLKVSAKLISGILSVQLFSMFCSTVLLKLFIGFLRTARAIFLCWCQSILRGTGDKGWYLIF